MQTAGARGAFSRAVAALLASGLLLLASYAALHGADRTASAKEKHIEGAQLSAVIGKASSDGESMVITDFQQVGDQWHAMVGFQGSFLAADFDLLEYYFRGQHPGLRANFLWRTAAAPAQRNQLELHSVQGNSSVIPLSGHAEWKGEITAFAVYFSGEPRSEPLAIDKMVFQSSGALQALLVLWSEWTAYRGWDLSSINKLYGSFHSATPSPVIAVAAWAGIAVILLFAFGLMERKQYLLSYCGAILIPWITLDILWQNELSTQLDESRYQFSGKSMHEKHLRDIDAGIYSYTKRLKASVLPASPARIFILHNSIGHNFERLKTQYYLLPHNVYNFGNSWRSKHFGSLRPGDYVLALGDVPGFPLGTGIAKLKWNSQNLRAVFEDGDMRGRLYRISASQVDQLDSAKTGDMPGD